MTKENVFKNFIKDPVLIEKGYMTKEEIKNIRFIDQSRSKLIEVIKMAIDCTVDQYGDSVAVRKINKFLNSGQL